MLRKYFYLLNEVRWKIIVGILSLRQSLVIYIEIIILFLILEGVFGLKHSRTKVVHVSDISVAKSHIEVLVTSEISLFCLSALLVLWQ